MHVAYRRGSVVLRQGDEIEEVVEGVLFTTDNALYGIAFGTHTNMDEDSGRSKEPCVTWGADPLREGEIFVGFPGHSKALEIFAAAVATAFATKGLIQSPITSCGRRDHSVCQASANSILKISGHRRCDEGGGGIAQHGRSLISMIVLFCFEVDFNLYLLP